MAGAMVASLVPATAFAKGDVSATAKIVDAKDMEKGEKLVFEDNDGPELQIKIDSADYTSDATPSLEFDLDLDNAEFVGYDEDKTDAENEAALRALVGLVKDEDSNLRAGVYHPGTSTTEYVETTEADAEGFAKKVDGEIDQDTFVSDFSAVVLAGDDLKEALISAGYAANASGDYTIDILSLPKTVTVSGYGDITFEATADQALYTTSEIAEGITVKSKAAVIADALAGDYVYVKEDEVGSGSDIDTEHGEIGLEVKDVTENSVTFKFYGQFDEDDKIVIDLDTKLTKTSEGTKASVSVDSKAVTVDDLVFASILGDGIKVSIKKTVDIAEDEKQTLYSNGLKIESAVGDFVKNQEFELKLSNGFEFSEVKDTTEYTFGTIDDNEVTVKYIGAGTDEFTIDGDDIEIEATSAKSGSVATLTVKALKDSDVAGTFSDTEKVEVAKVCDYKVDLTVDEDEDLPVIYSGTNVDNKGLTDDSDHWSLEVTAEETFPGAWSMRKGFNFNLPEGVYVTDVDVTDTENFVQGSADEAVDADDWQDAFFTAYQDGDHTNFEFEKRVFNDVNTELEEDPATVTFKLQLVADPTFEGDVVLKFEGDLVDEQEVTIAKFTKPYTVKAEQNDVIIDYRNTEVKTPIVITEAEAGLWEKDVDDLFKLNIEDDLLEFEDDATFTVDSDSDMKLKDEDTDKGTLVFTVDDESDDKAATVTISDMALFMQRNIPAGAYDLEISTVMSDAYDRQVLYAPDADTLTNKGNADDWDLGDDRPKTGDVKEDSYIDDVCDYSDVVKEAFINVVTAGVDKNNMFTTKVVVPVGESYLVAGEAKVELDAPAYISAAGYTMLPVRAVSKALGVDTNNVLWNAETRTVTIMYAQRIISMTVGQKTVYVNGSSIPTSAAPEITNGRTYLPLRDLGTALGVTNVSWDASTKTATLN
ncbi:copper amine oxidase N-terminal domain-containing protein [Anaerotignum sp.]|uniref:copper amine oxidase N-terminal domain-containing protein n=1 Tax=Anaerotignum sp. TaxID=2039241 RepID=UPI002714B792|nr:copper amine oxidase N-terminal domain-containing protein [Anaerotignum sp.]